MIAQTKIVTTAAARQGGAVLVVGLVLLLVLTVLALSVIRTASLDVAMATNTRFSENAFQLAETAIDLSIVNGAPFNTGAPYVVDPTDAAYEMGSYQATTSYNEATAPPAGGFSIGVGGTSFNAYHFDIVAVGRSGRDATATHTQSFYIVGPGGS